MKYILVTGGVISGVGKGVISSSIGTLLKNHGIRVTAIKIDPYINIDAGTFSPYEHGEVYVLNDGGEVDLDLGNYERFIDVNMTRENNITTGKIYKRVIDKERRGDYLGKTVQVVPHITSAIQDWVIDVAKRPTDKDDQRLQLEPEVCIIELGGTVGDIESMPFVEAFRQLRNKLRSDQFINVHVSLIVELKASNEQKTKPTQNGVRELMSCGIHPDVVICRSETIMSKATKEKISDFCNVTFDRVINVFDVESVYHVPLLLLEQGVLERIKERLNLKVPTKIPGMMQWERFVMHSNNMKSEVKIALVGKYAQYNDAYTSLIKGLYNRMILSEDLEDTMKATNYEKYQEAWRLVMDSHGVIVPGGFGSRGFEGKMAAMRYCRNHRKPCFGVCLGMQGMVVDFARDRLGLNDANSTEFDANTKHPLVIDMPEHNPGDMGGTMRLGIRTTTFRSESSVLRKLYGNVNSVDERHRHRYEVNPDFVDRLEKAGLKFVGHDGNRMEICELDDHPYFVGVQYHPEYLSRPLKPSPPYLGLILASIGKLEEVLKMDKVPHDLEEVINDSFHTKKYNGGNHSPMVIPRNNSVTFNSNGNSHCDS